MRRSFALCCWIIAFAPVFAQDAPSPRPLMSGPMVGHVTDSTALIWAATNDQPYDLELQFRVKGDANASTRHAGSYVRADADYTPVVFALMGLQPQTTYIYRILWKDESAAEMTTLDLDPWAAPANNGRSGEFTTAPPAGQPGKFTFAVSSCMHYERQPEQLSWRLLRSQQPSFHMLLGDVVYADTTDRNALWGHHLKQRDVVDFANLLRVTPTYAMYDDHDYGPNDSDGTAAGKENSLRAFNEVYAIPRTGTDKTPAAFYSFQWGDVEFFMLDGRYHRSPDNAPNDDAKRMLGDEQFAWLMEGLKNSTATFKVLASGSTLQASGGDGWRVYDFARNRLYNGIMENGIEGVMYLSGDVHASFIQVHETGGYPLVEVVSSGIANSRTNSFATLAFDTTAADPTVRVRIIYGDGSVPEDRTFKMSAMKAD
ncbi:MAG: alkaline phosphatase D family protein [Candidatus Poribacteria bacterium]|nr:alkaline phosphatase D family protein [Candidatus Poribacteria bacterium]